MPTKSEEIKTKAQEDLHAVVSLLVGASMMLVPFQYRMTKEDVDRIFIPLENIVVRHSETGSLNPDLVDLYLFAIGVILYVQRTKLVQSTFGNGRLKIRRKPTVNQQPNIQKSPVTQPTSQSGPSTTSRPNGQQNTVPPFSDANTALAHLYESVSIPE